VAYTPDGRVARRTLDGVDQQPVAEQISDSLIPTPARPAAVTISSDQNVVNG
jgi:hypothetical protein